MYMICDESIGRVYNVSYIKLGLYTISHNVSWLSVPKCILISELIIHFMPDTEHDTYIVHVMYVYNMTFKSATVTVPSKSHD